MNSAHAGRFMELVAASEHRTKQGRNGKNPEEIEALSETVNYEPRGCRSQLQPVTKFHIHKWNNQGAWVSK